VLPEIDKAACALQCEIVDYMSTAKLEAYVERLVEVRRKKNVTPDMARDFLADPNYFGTVRCPMTLRLQTGAVRIS
jgi:phosphotransacetylase